MFQRRVRVGECELQSHCDPLLVRLQLLCGVEHSNAGVEEAVRVQHAADLGQLLVWLHLGDLVEELVGHGRELRGDGGDVVGEDVHVRLVAVEVESAQERVQ